jgi:tyrosyl-tRNA synthetase
MPTTEVTKEQLENGINIIDLLVMTGLAPSKGEARRLITQGGVLVEDSKVDSIELVVGTADLKEGKLIIKKGKKTYHRIKVKE